VQLAAHAAAAAFTTLLACVVVSYGPLLPIALYLCLGPRTRARRWAWVVLGLMAAIAVAKFSLSDHRIGWLVALHAMPLAMLLGSLVALAQFGVVFQRRPPIATASPGSIQFSVTGLFVLVTLVAISLALHQLLRRQFSYQPLDLEVFNFATLVSLLALATTFAALWTFFGSGSIARRLVVPLIVVVSVAALLLIHPLWAAVSVLILAESAASFATLLILCSYGFRLTVEPQRSLATNAVEFRETPR
jgi:hypothetical protein